MQYATTAIIASAPSPPTTLPAMGPVLLGSFLRMLVWDGGALGPELVEGVNMVVDVFVVEAKMVVVDVFVVKVKMVVVVICD